MLKKLSGIFLFAFTATIILTVSAFAKPKINSTVKIYTDKVNERASVKLQTQLIMRKISVKIIRISRLSNIDKAKTFALLRTETKSKRLRFPIADIDNRFIAGANYNLIASLYQVDKEPRRPEPARREIRDNPNINRPNYPNKRVHRKEKIRGIVFIYTNSRGYRRARRVEKYLKMRGINVRLSDISRMPFRAKRRMRRILRRGIKNRRIMFPIARINGRYINNASIRMIKINHEISRSGRYVNNQKPVMPSGTRIFRLKKRELFNRGAYFVYRPRGRAGRFNSYFLRKSELFRILQKYNKTSLFNRNFSLNVYMKVTRSISDRRRRNRRFGRRSMRAMRNYMQIFYVTN